MVNYYYYPRLGFEEHIKNAIVVLTRGYNSNDEYDKLIDRNNSIYDKFYKFVEKNDYDVIIFHEGNITKDQQEYIQSKTPEMHLAFREIRFLEKDVNNSECPNTSLSGSFNNGYKNMCYFWSISFLEYLKDYNYIIRIDEDCVLKSINKNIIDEYKRSNIMFSSSYYQKDDDPEVVIGLKNLFDNYLKKNNLTKKNDISMPYTNFMVVNIQFFRNEKNVVSILDEIKKSDCIFSNRWGDLPIWGYVLSYFIDKFNYIEDKNISYFHESHSIQIN